MACFHPTPLTHHRRGEGGEKRRRREGEAGEVSGVGMVVNGSRINGYDQRIIQINGYLISTDRIFEKSRSNLE
jgi:hypothetical protein